MRPALLVTLCGLALIHSLPHQVAGADDSTPNTESISSAREEAEKTEADREPRSTDKPTATDGMASSTTTVQSDDSPDVTATEEKSTDAATTEKEKAPTAETTETAATDAAAKEKETADTAKTTDAESTDAATTAERGSETAAATEGQSTDVATTEGGKSSTTSKEDPEANTAAATEAESTDNPTAERGSTDTTATEGESTATANKEDTETPSAGGDSTPGVESTTSGEESTTKGGDSTTSGGDSTTSDGDSTTSGGDSTTSGGDPATSGGDSTTSGGDSTTSGGGSSTSGGGSTTTGSDSAASGGDSTTSGGSSTAGGETTTSGSSLDNSTTSADNSSTAETTTAGDPPPPAPEGSSVNLKVRYTIPWVAAYADSESDEAKAKMASLKTSLEPEMKKEIPEMTELRINGLREGSVVADYDVILNSTVEGGNKEAVQSAINDITEDGTIGDDPVSADDTTVTVLQCTNTPPAALVNGRRSWTGSKALDVEVLYTCNTGYTLKASNDETRENVKVKCSRAGEELLFGTIPDSLSCQANPTTAAPTTTTKAPTTTTAQPTTTELTRPMPKETPHVVNKHSTFTNSMFLSITIPAVAGMVAALVCFLCAIRIDSVLCRVCAEGKV